MAFASTTSIHSLIGNKTIFDSNGVDITSAALSDAVEKGDSRVVLETGVSSWTDSDIIFSSVEQVANLFGADWILGEYADDKDQATTYYQQGLDICASIARSSTQSLVIARKAYKTFPLNPEATIYRSIPAGGSDTLAGDE